jgi:hypothetical protein
VIRAAAALTLALLAPLAAWGAPSTQSGDACLRIATDIERAEKARKEAVEKGDNAWKTVLPFAVIARKASSKAAVDEADKQLAALRQQAAAEGCNDSR